METVLVLTTGGTIGSEAVDDIKRPPHFTDMPPEGTDLVCEALTTFFKTFSTRCLSLEPRDSKHIDLAYLEQMEETISAAPENKILITHGTDTLLKTVDFFFHRMASNANLKEKYLILTGSMVPLANGLLSDGYSNIEFALNCLAAPTSLQTHIGIVLCGYNTPNSTTGEWKPRFYPFVPGKYEKWYHPTDNRLNGLKYHPAWQSAD